MGWGTVIQGVSGVASSYMGARAQGKAAESAASVSRDASAASERTLMAQMEYERQQREIDRADAERRWTAEQEMARQQWAASEDERLWKRKIFEEDRANAAANRGGGGYSGPSLPDPRELRREKARMNLAALMAQGTPGVNAPWTPATAAGPIRG